MATLLDFGFIGPAPEIGIKKVETAIKAAIEKPVSIQEPIAQRDTGQPKYNTEYIIGLIIKDRYIFDLRGWPHGINRPEFDRLWDIDFEVDEEGFFWNAGHFRFALRGAKKLFRADKELIWKAIWSNRERQLKQLAEDWKHSAENEINYAKGCREPEDSEYWRACALHSWQLYNECLKAMDLKEQPVPPHIAEPVMCDPMHWGEPESSKKRKK